MRQMRCSRLVIRKFLPCALAPSVFRCSNGIAFSRAAQRTMTSTSDDNPAVAHGLSRRVLLQAAAASAVGALPAQAAVDNSADAPRDGHLRAFVIEAGWALIERGGELQLLRDATLLIRDGVIEQVGTSLAVGDLPRISLPQDLLLPGFISGHTHCCSATPTRGIIEGPRSYRRPLELVEQLSDDELDALTAVNLAELLRSGCTTQLEMSLSLRQAESYVRVCRTLGCTRLSGCDDSGHHAPVPDLVPRTGQCPAGR